MKLSLIIPCYNEAENIPLVIETLHEAVGKRTDIEVILVNNGSSDNSREVLNTELEKHQNPYIRILDIDKNQGYGHGILYGLEHSSNEILAWTHADMQTNPKDIIGAFESYRNLNNKNVFLKGRRKNRAFIESFFSFGFQILVILMLRIQLKDINAQPKMFSREFYNDHLKNKAPYDFSIDLFAYYMAKKFKYMLIEIPVVFSQRKYGEAKGGGSGWMNRWKLIIRTIKHIIKLSSS